MNTDTSNRHYLLQQLFQIVPLKVRGNPAYVYLEPRALIEAEAQLLRLEPLLRIILPSKEYCRLNNHRIAHKGRLVSRLILRANNITPVVEKQALGHVSTTRWNLGLFDAPLHVPLLWPENGGQMKSLEPESVNS